MTRHLMICNSNEDDERIMQIYISYNINIIYRIGTSILHKNNYVNVIFSTIRSDLIFYVLIKMKTFLKQADLLHLIREENEEEKHCA